MDGVEYSMDKVIIKDLKIKTIIGIYDHERTNPQEVVINAILFTDTHRAALTDQIGDCVDYEKIALRVKTYAQSSKRKTLEALVEDLAKLCLENPSVQGVNMRVEKTEAVPFTASVGVEIERMKPTFNRKQ